MVRRTPYAQKERMYIRMEPSRGELQALARAGRLHARAEGAATKTIAGFGNLRCTSRGARASKEWGGEGVRTGERERV